MQTLQGDGPSHTHCGGQLRRLLPGAEEDRGAGAEGGSEGEHVKCDSCDGHSQEEELEWQAEQNVILMIALKKTVKRTNPASAEWENAGPISS